MYRNFNLKNYIKNNKLYFFNFNFYFYFERYYNFFYKSLKFIINNKLKNNNKFINNATN